MKPEDKERHEFVKSLIYKKVPLSDDEVGFCEQRLSEEWEMYFDQDWLYNDPRYLWLQYISSTTFTDAHLSQCIKIAEKLNYKPEIVLDFGAGLGLTTVKLALAYPNSEIYYYDYPNDNVYEIAHKLFDKYNVKNVTTIEYEFDLKHINYDTLVVFEVLEHFTSPLAQLNDLLHEDLETVFESSWNKMYAGHYSTYEITGRHFQAKRIEREIRDFLIEKGFTRIERYTWNGKPNFYTNINVPDEFLYRGEKK